MILLLKKGDGGLAKCVGIASICGIFFSFWKHIRVFFTLILIGRFCTFSMGNLFLRFPPFSHRSFFLFIFMYFFKYNSQNFFLPNCPIKLYIQELSSQVLSFFSSECEEGRRGGDLKISPKSVRYYFLKSPLLICVFKYVCVYVGFVCLFIQGFKFKRYRHIKVN